MRYFIYLTIFLIAWLASTGQEINPHTKEPGYDKYDLENKTVKKNRIKYVTDSSKFIEPNGVRVSLYDTLGRLIGKLNRSIENLKSYYVYRTTGDTTYRLKYNEDKSKLICFERFVHNKKGKILNYLDCCNYYFKEDSYYVEYTDFYYDDKNRLQARLNYFKEDYPGKVSETNNILPTELHLNEAIYYSYTTLNNGNKLVIGKHSLGKPEWRATDTATYDKLNRLIRFNSYAKTAVVGELVHHNVNRITEYKYTDSSLLITDYITHCIAPLSNFECFKYENSDKDITLIIYKPDKTKKAVYGFYQNGKKYRMNKYEYTYY